MKENPKRSLIGIDVGSRQVKLVRVSPDDLAAGAPLCAKALVAAGSMQDGFVAQPADVVAAIGSVLGTAGVKERDVVSALSGSAVVVRPATLPRMKGSELLQAARWEAQRHIPLPVEDLVIDCAICGDDLAQAGMVQVVIAGGQRRAASALAAALVQSGLKPVALDADALAAYRALVALRSVPPTSVALLDIGGAVARLWIFTGGQLQVSRALTVGSDHLEADFAPACEDLVGELKRSIEFFMLRGKQSVSEICLLGGGAATPGLAQAVSELLNEAFAGRLGDGEQIGVSVIDPGRGPEYALAYGLALWEGH